jgi:hypothetical protein
MNGEAASLLKQFLAWVGQRLPQRHLVSLQATMNYILIGRWMSDRGFRFQNRVKQRQQVWSSVAKQVCDQKVLYLEFGVRYGDSMRYWSAALKHPETRLHGFDSFIGLPEQGGFDGQEGAPWAAGQFDTGGQIPVIEDRRVQFFKGWFNEVLPTYHPPAHDVLVVFMDADLYSSTIYVLRNLRPYFKTGTFIYFDEISHIAHEARAFEEFLMECGLEFRAVCADKTLAHVFFQCIG